MNMCDNEMTFVSLCLQATLFSLILLQIVWKSVPMVSWDKWIGKVVRLEMASEIDFYQHPQ